MQPSLLTIFCFSPHRRSSRFRITAHIAFHAGWSDAIFKGAYLASRSALDKTHADVIAHSRSEIPMCSPLKFEPVDVPRRFPLVSLLSSIGTRHRSGRVSRGLLLLDGQGHVSPKVGSSAVILLVFIRPPLSRARPQAGRPCQRRLAITFICRAPDADIACALGTGRYCSAFRLTSADKQFGDHHGSGRPVLDREARIDILEMSFHGLGSHAQNHPNFLVCLSLR